MEGTIERNPEEQDVKEDSISALIKALTCSARFAQDALLKPTKDALLISSSNSSKSGFCKTILHRAFFKHYSVDRARRPASAPTGSMEGFMAYVTVKTMLSYLRFNRINGKIRRLNLVLYDPSQLKDIGEGMGDSEERIPSREAYMLLEFIMAVPDGFVKTHRFQLDNGPEQWLEPCYAVKDFNYLIASVGNSETLASLVAMVADDPAGRVNCTFGQEEVTWEVTKSTSACWVYERSVLTHVSEEMTKTLKSCPIDYMRYESGPETISLGFHVREFSAFINFAVALGRPMKILWSQVPKPLMLEVMQEKDGGVVLMESSASIATHTPPPPITAEKATVDPTTIGERMTVDGTTAAKRTTVERTTTPSDERPRKVQKTSTADSNVLPHPRAGNKENEQIGMDGNERDHGEEPDGWRVMRRAPESPILPLAATLKMFRPALVGRQDVYDDASDDQEQTASAA
ncbi:hypothetical protein CALVIDRAFT_532053 [Calocera viscosa TUFC12733]|uniref:Rad9-domain-containing protein n=1 Tax=Calocera viscosa (strain TUFC12733) TaxID=1330018 RepID=A0A167FHD4_CALVF|nr:hypothetical protein CALVIDRAFT_532053 [Calocera viscosa TUFC12733]